MEATRSSKSPVYNKLTRCHIPEDDKIIREIRWKVWLVMQAWLASRVSDCQSDSLPLQLYTPLHAAAASGSVGVALILMESGAEVDARNSYGNTPLHIACLNGHSSLCSELAYCGADINALNYRGQVSDKSLYYTRPVSTVATVRIWPFTSAVCLFGSQRNFEHQVARQISWSPGKNRQPATTENYRSGLSYPYLSKNN
jgi:hypothetical protein